MGILRWIKQRLLLDIWKMGKVDFVNLVAFLAIVQLTMGFTEVITKLHAGVILHDFCRLLIFSYFVFLIISGVQTARSECQTILIEIRPKVLSGLIWVRTDWEDYRQTKTCNLIYNQLVEG